jgi:DNA repair protein RecN (Recombination protein N)
MLVELAVRNLGVIAEARIPVGQGLVALTGETGAGKTMVVEALELLTGGRADPARVRPGADEAVVEGLFAVGDTEWVLRRVVPAQGRSRSYLNGELSTAAALGELCATLLEIHGQHAQQALLQPGHQRDALDHFAALDTAPLRAARRHVQELHRRLDELGGDERSRAREIDLLRYQLDEIDRAAPEPGEEEALAADEDLLADAVAHQEAVAAAQELLGGDDGVVDGLARAVAALDGRAPFAASVARLRALAAELDDVLADLRGSADGIEPDDERLASVRARRQLLVELRRKYGDDLEEVLAHATRSRARLEELTSLDATRAAVEAELAAARAVVAAESERVGAARRAAAPALAERVAEVLGELALAGSRVVVDVSDTEGRPAAGDQVEVRLATNPGTEPGPLARVASGGELSRVMLALRLVLSGGPPTMVFDEVDAGVGGEAAVAVGRALARLGEDGQVMVVTHLPQVAAFADHQLRVAKHSDATSTVTVVETLDDPTRIIELSRMLSGSPDSATARDHAEELLVDAARQRGR